MLASFYVRYHHQIILDAFYKCFAYSYLGRIIGLTGNALPEDIDTFMRNGANLVLTKPIDKSLLLDELMTVLVF